MTTTTQQSISFIHPTLTTPRNKNTAFPQTSKQSTVKPSVTPNHSQMDYQIFKPATTSRQTNKQRKNLLETVFQILITFFLKKTKYQTPL